MKKQIIKGVLLRYSKKYNLWVNEEGTRVYREYKNKDYNRFLQIHKEDDGSKYLELKIPGIVKLDELVTDCFKPMPYDGKKYILVHKDGDLSNCNANNLEWKSVIKFDPLSTRRKLDNGITVTSKGKFYKGKEELQVVKEKEMQILTELLALTLLFIIRKRISMESMKRKV